MSKTRTYQVQNMKCGGCVAAATAAVEKLPGVEAAEFDLEAKSGTIIGDADPEQVVAALNAAGSCPGDTGQAGQGQQHQSNR